MNDILRRNSIWYIVSQKSVVGVRKLSWVVDFFSNSPHIITHTLFFYPQRRTISYYKMKMPASAENIYCMHSIDSVEIIATHIMFQSLHC